MFIFNHPIEPFSLMMKDWVILILCKLARLEMAKLENDLDIYYALEMQINKDKKMKLQQLWKNVILRDESWSEQVQQ